jgi:hypothetical protein
MIYLYLTLLILPLSFVLFERRFNTQQAVYYSGVIGGGIWLLLTLLISRDWTLSAEPLFLIILSAFALKLKNEILFKYQPCITQGVVCIALIFNETLFDLGQRYTPFIYHFLQTLSQSEFYIYFNCSLSRFIMLIQGVPFEFEVCREHLESLFIALETQISWSHLINQCIKVSFYPLLLHTLILAYVVYKRPDSVIWLAARLMIYPLILFANFIAFVSFFVGST